MYSDLTEREKTILRFIIQQFILTASPVGSRNITKKYEVGLSPATVRNIMADLEESGYIDHPHTSAGRVPTDLGYRKYVDSLMEIYRINTNVKQSIAKKLESSELDEEGVISLTSKLLSNITNQISCILFPKLESGILQKIQVVSISSNKIMVILTIESGLVKTITLEIKTEFDEKHLISTQQLLNERLSGLSLRQIRETFYERFKDLQSEDKPIITLFLESASKIFIDEVNENKLFIAGAKNILKQPEFEQSEKIQSIIELIEDKDVIIHILERNSELSGDNVFVSIGKENKLEKLEDYSLVAKEYHVGNAYGMLGVIGPKRMDYAKITAFVDYVSKVLSNYLSKR